MKFTQGWKIGEPDKVFSMAKEFKVPATGVLDYQRFVVDPGFKEDVWVQAAECRPGNRKVVHHIIVYILPPGQRDPYDADGTARPSSAGRPATCRRVMSPDTARLVPAGSKLVFEVHYTPDGTEQTDRSSVGISFAKRPAAQLRRDEHPGEHALPHPGQGCKPQGTDDISRFPTTRSCCRSCRTCTCEASAARYELTYPDGTTETLLSVPDYDFGWQSVYRFAKPLKVPKGSKLTWIGHWDNSADNPRNPDPNKAVFWGLQTWDEMQNGWMEVVWKTPKPSAHLTGVVPKRLISRKGK